MKKQSFEEMICRKISEKSGGKVIVEPDVVNRTNRGEVKILKLREADLRLMPLIYTDEYEQRWQTGEKLDDLVEEILEQIRGTKQMEPFPENFFSNYEPLKERIFCRIVNHEKNQKLLSEVPHEDRLDLAVLYYYQLEHPDLEAATITIREEHLKMWKIDADRLREDAWKNTLEKNRVRFRKLSEVLEECGVIEGEIMEENPLYLLTNPEGCYGAVCALYPGTLARCAKELHSDLYMLPSSIHEWLLLPASKKSSEYDSSDLRNMVREINRTQLEEREVLSDEIYYYDAERDLMTIV